MNLPFVSTLWNSAFIFNLWAFFNTRGIKCMHPAYASFFLPFLLRLAMVRAPYTDFFLERNPCFLALFLLLGLYVFDIRVNYLYTL